MLAGYAVLRRSQSAIANTFPKIRSAVGTGGEARLLPTLDADLIDHTRLAHSSKSPNNSLTAAALMQLEQKHSAPISNPLPMVIAAAKGAHLYDPHGNKILDLFTAYSVVNQGHANPNIMRAMAAQIQRLTITSRGIYNDQLPLFLEKLSKVTGFEQSIPMNSGAEAVETAMKLARRHGEKIKKIPENQTEIIVFKGNFHGRTISTLSMSSEAAYKSGFGPHLPNIVQVPYGDAEALKNAITKNTTAILIEPIQGEGGIVVPPPGFLQAAHSLARHHDVLFMVDEIQTGFGRTGKLFAYQHAEGVRPDIMILGKALSGGMYPVSAVVSSKEIMSVFTPGSHGSTFGGNPVAAATARAAMAEFDDGRLVENSRVRGNQIIQAIKAIDSPIVTDVRGRGLFIGVELNRDARAIVAELLTSEGMLANATHGNVVRIAPVLGISERDAEKIAPALARVLKKFENGQTNS